MHLWAACTHVSREAKFGGPGHHRAGERHTARRGDYAFDTSTKAWLPPRVAARDPLAAPAGCRSAPFEASAGAGVEQLHELENVHAEVGGKVLTSGCGPNLITQPSFPIANQRTAPNGLEEEGVLPFARGSGQNVWTRDPAVPQSWFTHPFPPLPPALQ